MKLGKSPTLLQSLAASVPREKHRGWGDGSMLDTLGTMLGFFHPSSFDWHHSLVRCSTRVAGK